MPQSDTGIDIFPFADVIDDGDADDGDADDHSFIIPQNVSN